MKNKGHPCLSIRTKEVIVCGISTFRYSMEYREAFNVQNMFFFVSGEREEKNAKIF